MKPRILVVEDEEIVLTGLAGDLEREGYEALTARSAAEALEALRAKPVDLVLTDLVMEGMDGMALLRRLRESEPALPVVVITGHGTPTSALEAVREGAADYIQKPARPEEIAHRIRTVLDAEALKRKMLGDRDAARHRHQVDRDRAARQDRMASIELFAEGVAAELRHAVDPLRRAAPRLAALLPADDASRAAAEQVKEAAERLAVLQRNLQRVGSLEANALEPVAFNEVVEEFLASRDFQAMQQSAIHVQISRDLPEGLPPARAARGRVRRALEILVANALDAMPDGGRLTLQTGREFHRDAPGHYAPAAEGEYVVLRVRHLGAMDRPHVDRAFEPYYAPRRMKRGRLGGFAMTTVYRIVRSHGGFIDVRTGADHGTVFALHFPAWAEASAPAGPAPGETPRGREHVLLVDDHDGQREAAAAALRELGYTVSAAESAAAALRHAEGWRAKGEPGADAAVVDLVLGDDMDGVDLYRRLVAVRPGLRAVLASGFADTDRIAEGRALGIAEVVRKPYTGEALGRAVRAALDRAADTAT